MKGECEECIYCYIHYNHGWRLIHFTDNYPAHSFLPPPTCSIHHSSFIEGAVKLLIKAVVISFLVLQTWPNLVKTFLLQKQSAIWHFMLFYCRPTQFLKTYPYTFITDPKNKIIIWKKNFHLTDQMDKIWPLLFVKLGIKDWLPNYHYGAYFQSHLCHGAVFNK